jgi:hypothetical protein
MPQLPGDNRDAWISSKATNCIIIPAGKFDAKSSNGFT